MTISPKQMVFNAHTISAFPPNRTRNIVLLRFLRQSLQHMNDISNRNKENSQQQQQQQQQAYRTDHTFTYHTKIYFMVALSTQWVIELVGFQFKLTTQRLFKCIQQSAECRVPSTRITCSLWCTSTLAVDSNNKADKIGVS